MGMRGKLPTDAALLRLRGTSAPKRQQGTGPPNFGAMDPTPPDGLDGVALETWRAMVPGLIADGTLHGPDRDVMEIYCTTNAECVALRATLRKEGAIIKGRAGIPKPHPAWRLLNRSEAMLLALAREIGVTPAARNRIQRHPPTAETTNPMAELVKCPKENDK